MKTPALYKDVNASNPPFFALSMDFKTFPLKTGAKNFVKALTKMDFGEEQVAKTKPDNPKIGFIQICPTSYS